MHRKLVRWDEIITPDLKFITPDLETLLKAKTCMYYCVMRTLIFQPLCQHVYQLVFLTPRNINANRKRLRETRVVCLLVKPDYMGCYRLLPQHHICFLTSWTVTHNLRNKLSICNWSIRPENAMDIVEDNAQLGSVSTCLAFVNITWNCARETLTLSQFMIDQWTRFEPFLIYM